MKTQTYVNFSRNLYVISLRGRIPLRALFELTYRCNFNCIHCYNTPEQKKRRLSEELSTEEVYQILRELKNAGCLYLGFTGGEVFCRHDIFSILHYAHNLGFIIVILTNGSMLDERAIKELKKIRLSKLSITLHSLKPDVFEKITQVPGSHGKVLGAIEFLRANRVPFSLKTTIMKENKEDVVLVNKFAKRMKVEHHIDGRLIPRFDHSQDPLKHLIEPGEFGLINRACNPHLARRDYLLKKMSRKRNLNRLFNCTVGKNQVSINPYGELKMCVLIEHPLYNIINGSLAEGWEHVKRCIDGLKVPKDWACLKCNLNAYCLWCPAQSYLTGRKFTNCSSYSIRMAMFDMY